MPSNYYARRPSYHLHAPMNIALPSSGICHASNALTISGFIAVSPKQAVKDRRVLTGLTTPTVKSRLGDINGP